MGYQRLDHTADTGLELCAETLPELFVEALRGFTDTVVDLARVESAREQRFFVRSPEPELLLVHWLEELLYEFDANARIFATAEVNLVEDESGCALSAVARGEIYDAERHGLKLPIKGVTYHGLVLREEQDGWMGRVVFDV